MHFATKATIHDSYNDDLKLVFLLKSENNIATLFILGYISHEYSY